MRRTKASKKTLACGATVAAVLLVLTTAFRSRGSLPLIPRPSEVRLTRGVHRLGASMCVVSEQPSFAAEFLVQRLRLATGWKVPLVTKRASTGPATIVLEKNLSNVASEAYKLTVTPERVEIGAADEAGLFYGVQTLLQLLPAQIFSNSVAPGVEWAMPCVRIVDHPRFAWRGLLLDVARHFFTKAEVKKVIDGMALHKLNRLQLHLTDDQGWRLDIAKYPRLTTVGGWRNGIGFKLDPSESTAYGPDGRYGGFYTETDVRELVEYAAQRNVEIIPEIEMPGHSMASLAAYAEHGCTGGPYSTGTSGGIFDGVLCAGQEATFEFVDNILTEVTRLFPGKYIHIGGDEVDKENWKKCAHCQARIQSEGLKNEQELQSYFIRRVAKILQARGRTLVGWSEIREGGLANDAVLMDWIGGGLEAATAGHKVIMTPTTFCYLDYYQSTNRVAEPRAIGGFLPLEKVYTFEPVPAELGPERHGAILGVQGNLWTEYIASLRHAEYMMYPRLSALAEAGWSSPGRDYPDFTRRLEHHIRRLELMGINYRRSTVER